MTTGTIVFGTDWGGTMADNEDIADGSENSIVNPDKRALGYLRQKVFGGALCAVRQIASANIRCHVISKIVMETWVQDRVNNWLRACGFYPYMPPKRVHFCAHRVEKKPICGRHRVTHYVDNNNGVHVHLIGIVPNLYLFMPGVTEREHWELVESGKVIPVQSWQEVAERVLADKRRLQKEAV